MYANRYLLCVDDDPDDRTLLKEAIERRTNTVPLKFLDSGDAVIKFLSFSVPKDQTPALIILDINMPKMDGKDTLLEIEKILPAYVPVLFLTTTPRDADVTFGENHTAALMAKPTDIKGYDELAKTILDLFFSKNDMR